MPSLSQSQAAWNDFADALKKTVSLMPGSDGENVKFTPAAGNVPETVMFLDVVAVCPTPLLTRRVTA